MACCASGELSLQQCMAAASGWEVWKLAHAGVAVVEAYGEARGQRVLAEPAAAAMIVCALHSPRHTHLRCPGKVRCVSLSISASTSGLSWPCRQAVAYAQL